MVTSVLILVFIYYPIVLLFIGPQPSFKNESYWISIPKISASARIIENVDPWNESEYRKTLERGVAQAKNTAEPGQKGTLYLFAHSSDVPWRITRYNVAFLRLGELQKGDTFTIHKKGKTYRYAVLGSKIVWPSEVDYLTKNQGDVVILQTCYPIGTSLQRLLVFAAQVQ